MEIGCKLCADDESPNVDQKLDKYMIGSIPFLKTSRPNIMLVVGLVARYHSTPKQSHLLETKMVFRYSKGTTNYGLWCPQGKDFTLPAYTDAD